MNIFRIFFVSTVLIPILVVVATSDDSGIRIRKPRAIVIAEDGTRTGRRHNPVNISDRNCPSIGCSGNLTTNANNGKGSLASTLLPSEGAESSTREERFDSPDAFPNHHHQHPLKLEIKSIKNSTRVDLGEQRSIEHGEGRAFVTAAIVVSWIIFWGWRAICSFLVYNVFSHFFSHYKKRNGIGDDYVETYIKVGKDAKHPFGNYGAGWNPIFGISLKSKVEEHGWKGEPHGHHHYPAHGHYHHPHHSSSYHHPQAPSGYPGGWPSPSHEKTSSEEAEDNLKLEYDRTKGLKYAKKHAKKYGKYAHKYGLRPSKDQQIKCALKTTEGSKCKRKLNATTATNSTLGFKKKTGAGGLLTSGLPFDDERFSPVKPYHPAPLKLEIKSIKNSTRTDAVNINNLVADEGNGRAFFFTAAILVSLIAKWCWKVFWHIFGHKFGWGKDHFETYITLGTDQQHGHTGHGHGHGPHGFQVQHSKFKDGHLVGGYSKSFEVGHLKKGHRHGGHSSGVGQLKHGHGAGGWSQSYDDIGHHNHKQSKGKHVPPYLWYHPATKYFVQPTYQYSPKGKEYTLYGYDQHKAVKYRKKYNKKWTKYKKKYYRKKGKEWKKAQREYKKAQRRKKKAEKWKAFTDRLKGKGKGHGKGKGNKAGDDDDVHDDLEHHDNEDSWEETSSEIEHGTAPQNKHYAPGYDYDPLPAGNDKNIFRIVGRR